MINLLAGGFIDEFIYTFPLSQSGIDNLPLWNGLVRPGGIDLEGSFAIHPVVSPAKPCPFRADDTDVAGRKGLTESAGVEGVYGLIRHPFDTDVPLLVDLPCLCENLIDLFLISIDLDLDFIEDGSEVLVKFCVKDFAEMGEAKSLLHSPFADPYPGDVPLTDMHHSLGIVDEMVDLALENRFKVLLHLPARHFSDDGNGKSSRRFCLIEIRPDENHFAVFHFIHGKGGDPLHRMGSSSSAFHSDILAPYPFPLKRRAIRDGNGDFGDSHL